MHHGRSKQTSEQQARLWHEENAEAIDAQGEFIRDHGVPGSKLAFSYPRTGPLESKRYSND
ncbi:MULTISPECIES: type II toxin-antitoxin system CcdA family antitoxin [Roseobacteraceae]|uniref:type II toxin-antitoxin system CcdA family antitoxin n=1 Tax=Roseobacteraceae TaxID=2854170 RepID=UPI003BAAE9F3